MANILNFGDVFKYRNEYFVFLASTPENTYYAAKIISKDQTQILKRATSNLGTTRSYRLDNIVYCFVELATNEFREQAAHFKTATDGGSYLFDEIVGTLDSIDLSNIKKEILEARALPELLKKLVKDIPA